MENDEDVIGKYQDNAAFKEGVLAEVKKTTDEILATSGMEPEMVIWIRDMNSLTVVSKAVVRPKEEIDTISDKIDRVVTHKYFGIYLCPYYVYNLSAYLYHWSGYIRGSLGWWNRETGRTGCWLA